MYTTTVLCLKFDDLPTKVICPKIVLAADCDDPKSMGLQFHCPSHDSGIENLSCMHVGQGLVVGFKQEFYFVQVFAKLFNTPDNNQTFFLNHGVVLFPR